MSKPFVNVATVLALLAAAGMAGGVAGTAVCGLASVDGGALDIALGISAATGRWGAGGSWAFALGAAGAAA